MRHPVTKALFPRNVRKPFARIFVFTYSASPISYPCLKLASIFAVRRRIVLDDNGFKKPQYRPLDGDFFYYLSPIMTKFISCGL